MNGRLLAKGSVQADPARPNSLASGHRACAGCGEALAARWVLDAAVRATASKLFVVNATGCLEVVSTSYPESAWRVPWLHSLFGNAPAVAAGVAAGLAARGRSDIRVLAQGGDGATSDIGFGCLSGMFERNDDVLYVCFDNEAYMNTGVQRSGATVHGARTATTPRGATGGKSVPLLALAHEIPWVGTATVADVHDLEAKVMRAMALRGARYLHVHAPCPLGWGSDPALTIEVARRGVACGLFPLFEGEHGRITGYREPRSPIDVTEYLSLQKRFSEMSVDQVADLRAIARANHERFAR